MRREAVALEVLDPRRLHPAVFSELVVAVTARFGRRAKLPGRVPLVFAGCSDHDGVVIGTYRRRWIRVRGEVVARAHPRDVHRVPSRHEQGAVPLDERPTAGLFHLRIERRRVDRETRDGVIDGEGSSVRFCIDASNVVRNVRADVALDRRVPSGVPSRVPSRVRVRVVTACAQRKQDETHRRNANTEFRTEARRHGVRRSLRSSVSLSLRAKLSEERVDSPAAPLGVSVP